LENILVTHEPMDVKVLLFLMANLKYMLQYG